MRRLDAIENKVATVELIVSCEINIHNHITQFGSKIGVTLKNLREKEPIVNEKLDQDSSRIGKLEDIITNLGSSITSIQTIPPNTSMFFMFLETRVNALEKVMKILRW